MTTRKTASVQLLEKLTGGPVTFGGFLEAVRLGEELTQPAFANPQCQRSCRIKVHAAALRAATREAEEALANNSAFRQKLLETARSATRYLVDIGQPAKSAETRFLAKALE